MNKQFIKKKHGLEYPADKFKGIVREECRFLPIAKIDVLVDEYMASNPKNVYTYEDLKVFAKFSKPRSGIWSMGNGFTDREIHTSHETR